METCVYAEDLDAAETFYGDILGLERIASEPGRHVFFRCGQGVFLVFNPNKTIKPNSEFPVHGPQGPGHAAFRVTEEQLEDWKKALPDKGVPIEKEIQWKSGGRSIYFRDPAGNSIELVTPQTWGL